MEDRLTVTIAAVSLAVIAFAFLGLGAVLWRFALWGVC